MCSIGRRRRSAQKRGLSTHKGGFNRSKLYEGVSVIRNGCSHLSQKILHAELVSTVTEKTAIIIVSLECLSSFQWQRHERGATG